MKLSDKGLNLGTKDILVVKRTVSENSCYQQAEFSDKLICTKTQTNLNRSKANKKILVLDPKKKLSQVIYNFKSSDFFSKIKKQKKQALKKQWMNMKKSNSRKVQNNNLHSHEIETKGKLNEFEVQSIPLKQQKGTKQMQQKRQQKRKRSKTQMLVHDYDLQKIGTLEQSSQDAQNFNNFMRFQKNSRQSNLLNSTISQKSESKSFVLSESKPKTYLQQMREAAQISSKSQNENKIRQKLSEKIQEQQNNHCLSRLRNPISKTVMVQKIINLRKTFNDKYKKNQNKTIEVNSINQSSYSKHKKAYQSQCEGNSSPIIPYMSYPVMNHKVTRKLTFQELFQNQKKKMNFLKKYVNKGGVFNSFSIEHNYDMSQSRILASQILTNLMQSSHLSESKSLSIHQNKNQSKQINYLSHGKNLYRGKVKWSDLQKEQIKTIKSRSKIQTQDLLNIQSIPTIDPSKQLQNDLLQNSNAQSQTPKRHLTIYEFDQMGKNLQKSQIKQLRHKYLYSSKRKILKEESYKQGISTIEVHARDQKSLKKLKIECHTEIITQKCMQIEKRVQQNWDRMDKTATNFIKPYLQNKKTAFLGKQNHLRQKQQNKKWSNFEPWQNRMTQSFCEQSMTLFSD